MPKVKAKIVVKKNNKNKASVALDNAMKKVEIAKRKWREALMRSKAIQKELRQKLLALKIEYQEKLTHVKTTAYIKARAAILEQLARETKAADKTHKIKAVKKSKTKPLIKTTKKKKTNKLRKRA